MLKLNDKIHLGINEQYVNGAVRNFRTEEKLATFKTRSDCVKAKFFFDVFIFFRFRSHFRLL